MKNLSDGELLLEAPEILSPATRLRLQLHAQQGVRPLEGEVRWNDAERYGNNPPVAHGIRFAGPVVLGLAVDLFVSESQRPPPGK